MKNLMHALTGGLLGQASIANANNAAQQASAYGNILKETAIRNPKNHIIFDGRINVTKVANGYVINIATREGYEFETYIASTVQEVNERIAASMVSFQLEGK